MLGSFSVDGNGNIVLQKNAENTMGGTCDKRGSFKEDGKENYIFALNRKKRNLK